MPFRYSPMVRMLRNRVCSGSEPIQFATLGSGLAPLTSAMTLVSSNQPFTERLPCPYRFPVPHPDAPDEGPGENGPAAPALWARGGADGIVRARGSRPPLCHGPSLTVAPLSRLDGRPR